MPFSDESEQEHSLNARKYKITPMLRLSLFRVENKIIHELFDAQTLYTLSFSSLIFKFRISVLPTPGFDLHENIRK